MLTLRKNELRARNAILLIGIVLALEIVSIVSNLIQYDLLQSIANGYYISEEVATANDTREQIIGVVYLIVYYISFITFIKWFRRAYYNLHQKIDNLSYSEGWAAGSWFVPIIHLYRPYKIMKELYVKTKEFLQSKNEEEKVSYTTSYLGWWWALWIIDGVLSKAVYRLSKKADSVTDLLSVTTWSIISSIVGIIGAIITIKVIKDYSRVEPILLEVEKKEIQIENTELN
ncbi:MAG: DUF4328 domain-containing protein [Bacteroidales bacterium]|jgi:hypothetical protein|nr:DUF4328 domain-containing protein [Bacteroidales bacterium]